MFEKIGQKIANKILPLIVEGHRIHKKAMLVNATSNLMASGRYPAGDPSKAFETAKKIIELVEAE